jgi:CRP/FNR family transcriptional regulator, cyclic AMP receptor protein
MSTHRAGSQREIAVGGSRLWRLTASRAAYRDRQVLPPRRPPNVDPTGSPVLPLAEVEDTPSRGGCLPSLSDSHARRAVDGVTLMRTHPVFGALAPAQIRQLGSFARVRRIVSGTTLFVKGDPGAALFALVSGTVKITVPSIDGREATFNLLHTGESVGEIALLDGQPRSAGAVAVTDCELIVIERRDFLGFVHGEPKVAMKLIELLCGRLRVAAAREEEMIFLNLPARLARLLLRLLEENAAAADKNRLSITQQKISEILGATRESVNKHLQTWARRRVIALKRGTILVLAPRALAALVSGSDDGKWR